ncbi:venom acid phosphatase Acph-1-like [Apis laboriosa]|uniref:venom acid phosphatase Acph-1-like n=1 Tax=Apis laboriosa TaxID=183418 RepID=UPI001CC644E1|nr:venom acid phosphatase Acph-1-like [Apis laboriosa]
MADKERYLQIILILNLLLQFCSSTNNKDKYTLESVHIIFRHGDRTPSKLEIYPKAPYNSIYESLGYGQLTDKGKIREFQLGALLRAKYSKFLGGHHTFGSVYAYSSDVDRTKMSLQLVLAGIYPPMIDEEGHIRLSPIPTYYMPNIVDKIMFSSLCPKYIKEYFRVSNLPIIHKEILKNKDLLNYLKEHTGLDMIINPLFQIYKLYHFLMSQISMNIALPKWATENVRNRIEKLVALEYNILSYNTLMKRLNGGFIIKEFLKNLNKKNESAPKIYVYSGHELNIAAFAKAHDLIEPKLPAFGSAIIVEKLRNQCGVAYIQMHLWTGVTEQLITYKIPKCEKICPYNKYLKLIEHVIPFDEEINCLWNNVSMNILQEYYDGDKMPIYNILSL